MWITTLEAYMHFEQLSIMRFVYISILQKICNIKSSNCL